MRKYASVSSALSGQWEGRCSALSRCQLPSDVYKGKVQELDPETYKFFTVEKAARIEVVEV